MPAKSTRRQPAAVRPLQGTVFITRQVHFNSAHRLHNPAKSQKWNEAQYGLCTNPHWHGHNYVLEVTVRGEPDPETGYILDLGELKPSWTSATTAT
jgi:6-pyruvoyltetrahydropterin/6-carboxytetrahydropterin synthase